jgi:hypothetical protein
MCSHRWGCGCHRRRPGSLHSFDFLGSASSGVPAGHRAGDPSTFICHRAIRSVKAKFRALTGRASQQGLGTC